MSSKIVTYARALLLLVVVMGFTACQEDETIFDRIVGRTWVGDLGFVDDYDDELESGVTFDGNGFGEDEQRCNYNHERIYLPIRWEIEGGTLFLDYGNRFPLLELRGVYVSGRYLTGTLYVEGASEGSVSLERLD